MSEANDMLLMSAFAELSTRLALIESQQSVILAQLAQPAAAITPTAAPVASNPRGAILSVDLKATDPTAAQDSDDPSVAAGAEDEYGMTCHAYMALLARQHSCAHASVWQYVRGNRSKYNALWPLRAAATNPQVAAKMGVQPAPLWRNHRLLRWLTQEAEVEQADGTVTRVPRYHAILQTAGPVVARTAVLLDMMPEFAIEAVASEVKGAWLPAA